MTFSSFMNFAIALIYWKRHAAPPKVLQFLEYYFWIKGYYHSIPLPENTKKIATECTELEEFSLSLYEVDDDEIYMDFFCTNLTPNLKKIGLVGEISKNSLLSLVSRCNKLRCSPCALDSWVKRWTTWLHSLKNCDL